ncbi:PK [Lepeophtheirus salmonis]|uniref:Pyruvate kinase n=1 Tax=Lepeophtheirus salmonis TaxID=72036 RepID=A0A7R8CKG0_LEPSM|nr:PK [Lepeophtheirus salmonis]CAF2847650.1 PK [Lepeophtheirus salmonis]
MDMVALVARILLFAMKNRLESNITSGFRERKHFQFIYQKLYFNPSSKYTMVWITNQEYEESTILPKTDLPRGQEQASNGSHSKVEFNSKLDILSRANKVRLSGIVCTIGPVSREVEYLCSLIESGMNIARMNFSHGSHEYHSQTIKNCREADKLYKEKKGFSPNLAIALDTKGPEIRTGLLEGDDGRKEVELEKGAKIKLTTNEEFKEKCTKEVLYLDYKNITKVMVPGKRVFIDDGLISVVAEEIGDDHVIGTIENGGNLGSRKGCNLPGTDTDLPAVSEKDKSDLQLGVDLGEIRDVLGEAGKDILIIPKIENQQGCNNIDEIIEASDGIMVARGDMGIEIPTEKKPRPTRAEGADVANAILDGADCVMLSGETAKGDYPTTCVRTMAALAKEAESCFYNSRLFEQLISYDEMKDCSETTAIAAVQSSLLNRASAIIVLSETGRTAKLASKFRPKCPIVVSTHDGAVARKCNLHRGLIPLLYEGEKSVDSQMKHAIDFLPRSSDSLVLEILLSSSVDVLTPPHVSA